MPARSWSATQREVLRDRMGTQASEMDIQRGKIPDHGDYGPSSPTSDI